MNNQPNLDPGKTEAERFLRQPKGTLPTNTANVVERITTLENKVTVLENKQTIFIDYWQDTEPNTPLEADVWFDSGDNILSVYTEGVWMIIPWSEESIYINRADNISYVWTGSMLTPASSVLSFATKEEAELGLSEEDVMSPKTTKDAINYNIGAATQTALDTKSNLTRTIALSAFDIVLKDGEDFTKLTGMNTNQTFTINAAGLVLKKSFRLFMTGGTIPAQPFTGYTAIWILNALNTDYVSASTNILVGEITGVNTIKLFWTE